MKIYENLNLQDLDVEIWKDILDYEGLYQVSNLGRIKSFAKYHGTNERVLKQSKSSTGYFKVILSKNKKYSTKKIHILVFETFYNYKLKKVEIVHHIDGNKKNNYYKNLKLMTKSEHHSFHNKGKYHSEETKIKIRKNHIGMKGKHHSEKTRNKMSNERTKENNLFFGKHHSEKSKMKISESKKKNNLKKL